MRTINSLAVISRDSFPYTFPFTFYGEEIIGGRSLLSSTGRALNDSAGRTTQDSSGRTTQSSVGRTINSLS